jgi:hypothetical protein
MVARENSISSYNKIWKVCGCKAIGLAGKLATAAPRVHVLRAAAALAVAAS